MTRKLQLLSALLAAVVIGAGLTVFSFGQSPVQESVKALGATTRYQISAWCSSASNGHPMMHGAYVVDAQTGKVWSIINDHEPREIGAVNK